MNPVGPLTLQTKCVHLLWLIFIKESDRIRNADSYNDPGYIYILFFKKNLTKTVKLTLLFLFISEKIKVCRD